MRPTQRQIKWFFTLPWTSALVTSWVCLLGSTVAATRACFSVWRFSSQGLSWAVSLTAFQRFRVLTAPLHLFLSIFSVTSGTSYLYLFLEGRGLKEEEYVVSIPSFFPNCYFHFQKSWANFHKCNINFQDFTMVLTLKHYYTEFAKADWSIPAEASCLEHTASHCLWWTNTFPQMQHQIPGIHPRSQS